MPSKLPRVNVTVTEEQHALLLELAALNGGSAAGYLRQMLDQATPLLRAVLPAIRSATEEMNTAQDSLNTILRAAQEAGLRVEQPDLLDSANSGAPRTERSEGGRAAKSGVGNPPSSNTGVRSGPKRDQKGNKAR